MKVVGFLLIALGAGLMLFVGYTFFRESNRTLSPVPENQGVKVIFVTPTP